MHRYTYTDVDLHSHVYDRHALMESIQR